MKTRGQRIITVIGLCVFLAGCKPMSEAERAEAYQALLIEGFEADGTETEVYAPTSPPAVKTERPADITVFQGEKYSFYKVSDDLYPGGYKIRGVYETFQPVEGNSHGLFVGQVVTMFGDENVTGDNEALLSYTVAAENKNGEVIYLEVYYGPSGPAIGGWEGENYETAAKELEHIIRKIEPIDYSCESMYYDMIDVGGLTVMGTKDGVGFYRVKIGDEWY